MLINDRSIMGSNFFYNIVLVVDTIIGQGLISIGIADNRCFNTATQRQTLNIIHRDIIVHLIHVRFDIHPSFLQEFIGPEGWDVG